jgi:hypothetical protein
MAHRVVPDAVVRVLKRNTRPVPLWDAASSTVVLNIAINVRNTLAGNTKKQVKKTRLFPMLKSSSISTKRKKTSFDT